MCSLHSESGCVNTGSRQLFDVRGYNSQGEVCLEVGRGLDLEAAISCARGFNTGGQQFVAVVMPAQSVKLGGLDSEAPSGGSPVCSCSDDSDATEGTENAAETNLEDDSEADDEPQLPERNRRVVVMRGNGEMDIVSGLLTDEEACLEAEKFEGIEAVYTVREWTTSEPTVSVQDARVRFIQAAVRSQLAVIGKAVRFVSDSGDIGLLAMSLREVAKQVDGISENGSIDEVPDLWGFDDAMDAEGWNNDSLKVALGLKAEVEA